MESWSQRSSTFAFFSVMLRSLPDFAIWKELSCGAIGPGKLDERSVQERPLQSTARTTTWRSWKSTWASRKVRSLPLSMSAVTWNFTVPGLRCPSDLLAVLLKVEPLVEVGVCAPAEDADVLPADLQLLMKRARTARGSSGERGASCGPRSASSTASRPMPPSMKTPASWSEMRSACSSGAASPRSSRVALTSATLRWSSRVDAGASSSGAALLELLPHPSPCSVSISWCLTGLRPPLRLGCSAAATVPGASPTDSVGVGSRVRSTASRSLTSCSECLTGL
mmetsp:Transcript_39867/g.113858  ORF Transcript_39867/g.113858 Transcript_39867/m.113858 type:complete len:281 (+) Transcript_39867:270-1112(+)